MYNIGAMAGTIWKVLSNSGKMQFKKLKEEAILEHSELPMKEQRFAMAIGWLAREEKIVFSEEGNGRRYRLYLELK